jgi:hypothetical protein
MTDLPQADDGYMLRRKRFVLGALLLLVGISLPLLGYRNQISGVGLMPFDAAIDLSGNQIKIAFVAQRTDRYEALVAMTLPTAATEHSTLACLLRSPHAAQDNVCGESGQLDAAAIIVDSNGARQMLDESYSSIGYEIVGGSQITAKRMLGYFNAVSGHHYTVIARFKSNNPTVKHLKPRLSAFLNDPGIGEAIMLSNFIFFVSLILGVLFAIVGMSLIAIFYRRGKTLA